ncbi:MAG: hypothetical protein WC006_02945 [Bacilli bacterium]|nr:hypothetical protein [Bacilli bacterium]
MNKIELEKRYNLSRTNLLILIALSVVNIITLVVNNSYFLFSLSFPRFVQMVIDLGIAEGMFTLADLNYPMVITVMALPIVLFLLCYIFSSKHRYKTFIFAIILFSIDSIFALISFDIIDIIFHIYIYVLLVMGFVNGKKLTKMQVVDDIIDFEEGKYVNYTEDSNILRNDIEEGKVLIQTTFNDLRIAVKKRKGVTELIINDNVYDEFTKKLAAYFFLKATVSGTEIYFSMDRGRMEIYANGNLIEKKIKWI